MLSSLLLFLDLQFIILSGEDDMSYCVPNDIRQTTFQVAGKDLTDTEIQVYIDMADNEINSLLQPYYTIPFSPVPPLIKTISQSLATGLCLRRLYTGHAKNTAPNEGSWVRDARSLLNEVLSGRKELVDSTGQVITRKQILTSTNPVRVMPEIDATYPDYFTVSR